MSFLKSTIDVSRWDPSFQTLFAHSSNARSWVTPRSSVMGSNLVRPGDFSSIPGWPPSLCSTTSVDRTKALTRSTPATYWPSHLTLNLKLLYGSLRMPAIIRSSLVRGRRRSALRQPAPRFLQRCERVHQNASVVDELDHLLDRDLAQAGCRGHQCETFEAGLHKERSPDLICPGLILVHDHLHLSGVAEIADGSPVLDCLQSLHQSSAELGAVGQGLPFGMDASMDAVPSD